MATNTYKVLLDAVDSHEIEPSEAHAAQHIGFHISDEDIILFIQGLRNHAPLTHEYILRNLYAVEYVGDHVVLPEEFDGAYVAVFADGTYSLLAWKDSDRVSMLYPCIGSIRDD